MAWRDWLVAGTLLLSPVVALADQPTVNVQIINVCASDGTQCALSNPYLSTSFNSDAIRDVFAQAGIRVNLLTPVQYNDSTYLNAAVIDDPSNGYLTGSPTDPAHQLLDLPGHRQDTDPRVLNLFAVNTLPHSSVVAGVSTPRGVLYGLGLQNANGAIVTTGLYATATPGTFNIAGLDNVAHELGHNLGLFHANDPPLAGTYVAAGTAVTQPAASGVYSDQVPVGTAFNLTTGSGRAVPRTLCGIVGVVCDSSSNVVAAGDPTAATVGQKDSLLPFQIATLQDQATNLFTVNLASVSATALNTAPAPFNPGFLQCAPQSGISANRCDIDLAFPSSSSTASLNEVRVRFPGLSLGSPATIFQVLSATTPCLQQSRGIYLAAGGEEIDFYFQPGCFTQGNRATLSIDDLFPHPGGGPFVAAPSYADFTPFSFEFDFSDGVTSLAAFDSSGVALSTAPIALGNLNTPNQDGPGLPVPTDPVLFNAGVPAEDDGGVMVEVTEPHSVALFGGAVLGAALLSPLLRRRRTS